MRRDDATVELSAIVLGYRAGESLLRVVEPLYRLLGDAGVPFQLVVVANYWPGSTDPTVAVAERFAAAREGVTVVSGEKRGGMGWDMRSGLAAASGDYIVVIDGDAQNPVDDIVRMYRELKATGADVMKGRRTLRHDGLYRRLVSIVYNVAFRLFFGTAGLWDINGKPKGLTRAAYERLDLRSDDWFVDAEIVLQARERGLRIEELPVEFFRNDERASFVRASAIWEFARNMLRARLGRRE